MKKILIIFMLINSILTLAKQNLKFQVIEKNNTNIKILIKADKKINNYIETKKENYIVKPGDTLSKIANKYKTTVYYLMKINKIQNKNLIFINQKILIKGDD